MTRTNDARTEPQCIVGFSIFPRRVEICGLRFETAQNTSKKGSQNQIMLMPSRRARDCAAQSFLLPSAKRKVDDCKGFFGSDRGDDDFSP